MARLVINPDSPEAWEIELRPGPNLLGSSEQNDFQIQHSSVSSSHCQIDTSGNHALLKDLGSTSGTFVDGQLVEQANLRSGQVFCLGDVRLRFESDAADEPAPAPSFGAPAARPTIRVASGPRMRPQPAFAAGACRAFLYPLKKDGTLLLLSGTIFLSIIEAVKFFARFAAARGIGFGSLISLAFLLLLTALGAGFLTSYLRRIVTSTAMGEHAVPDWPDLSDFVGDILAPLGQLVAITLACLLPAFIVAMFVNITHGPGQIALWAACALGGIYFPMAFLAVAMFDSVAAINPFLVVPSIAKIPGSYLVTVVLLGAVLAAKWAGDHFLPRFIPLPIVPSVISILVGLYLLMIQARVLGLLYLLNKDRLAWFGRR